MYWERLDDWPNWLASWIGDIEQALWLFFSWNVFGNLLDFCRTDTRLIYQWNWHTFSIGLGNLLDLDFEILCFTVHCCEVYLIHSFVVCSSGDTWVFLHNIHINIKPWSKNCISLYKQTVCPLKKLILVIWSNISAIAIGWEKHAFRSGTW